MLLVVVRSCEIYYCMLNFKFGEKLKPQESNNRNRVIDGCCAAEALSLEGHACKNDEPIKPVFVHTSKALSSSLLLAISNKKP